MSTADIYRVFAERETRGVSPAYERLSRTVAGDPELLALLDTLPPAKRQPNLLFGVVRLPVLDCVLTGVDPPARRPEVVWRAGLDVNPLDVTDPADVAWLEALIWPEHRHRRERLRAAAAVAAADPPLLVRGDLVDDLPALAARAPAGATLVVFHSSVLYQVPKARRDAFTALVRTLPGHWIANEDPSVLPLADLPEPPADGFHNVLAQDGRPVAWTTGHGQSITWFR
ncbi:DUF2332 family protein [Micromonospora marina]|uniref:DUF2332 domain-containing protein n=1 Tax=Micromonospora marina TaxID=307120 RepID=A0A1C4WN72_9ACTN|nr:DUF2332 family protein [Micromonospora marina]SCE97632.1 hypothetical protein GA0070215_105134 [Micromonospora marina]